MLQTVETHRTWSPQQREGRMAAHDLSRRSTYPASADPDTVALCEHYRLRYDHARLLKALSFGITVTIEELSFASGTPLPIIPNEMTILENRLPFRFRDCRGSGGKMVWYILDDKRALEDVRAAMRASW